MKSTYLVISLFAMNCGLCAQESSAQQPVADDEQLAIQRKASIAQIDALAMKFNWQELQKLFKKNEIKMVTKDDLAPVITRIKAQPTKKHIAGGLLLALASSFYCISISDLSYKKKQGRDNCWYLSRPFSEDLLAFYDQGDQEEAIWAREMQVHYMDKIKKDVFSFGGRLRLPYIYQDYIKIAGVLGINALYWHWALKEVFAKNRTLKVLADFEKQLSV